MMTEGSMVNSSEDRLSNLDVLRGCAALFVSFFHFDRNGFMGVPWLCWFTRHGYLGVDIFFVISGFVIPWALLRSGFHVADTGRFLSARFFRLYPAYFLACLVAMGLWFLSAQTPWFKGTQPSFTVTQLLANFTLSCDFQGQSWLQPVFWTLAIEAQYYILIAFCFPLLASQSLRIRLASLIVWISLPVLFGASSTVFSYTALFGMGVICFMFRTNLIDRTHFWVLTLGCVVIHTVTNHWINASVGLMALLAIMYLPKINSRILIWVGTVSYSLYLLHIPFGGRIVNLAERLPDHPVIRISAVVMALVLSLLAAHVFYRFVESPSHRFSRNIRRPSSV
jgi:peptidoglycan/LPS O-acetylase OafA/YrhL